MWQNSLAVIEGGYGDRQPTARDILEAVVILVDDGFGAPLRVEVWCL